MDCYLENNEITVLIPAHNEEEIISKTLESVYSQVLKPGEVIIICDNCTDNTISKIEEFKNKTKEDVKIFETTNNNRKKAGALNQTLKKLKINKYVLIMDADTLIDRYILESGLHIFRKDKNIAAVCSRAGILPYEGKSLWKRLIWTLQHIEYGQFDSHRIETNGNIKVAHGMATLFRVEALKSIPKYREKALGIQSGIYLEDNLVEDYEITLCLKHTWKVATSMDMLAWTDVPLSIKELWIQRLRWLRGGVDTLRQHGWNRITCFEILNHWLFIFLVILRVLAIILFLKYVNRYGFQGFNLVIIWVILLAFIDSLYRLKYVQNITLWDYFLKILIIPEIIYGWFQAIVLIYSYILSFCNIKQRW